MKPFLPVAAVIAFAAVSPAQAAVTYSFSTDEPFAGGPLAFTYQAASFVDDTGFIEAAALTGVVGNIQRVRFLASCPLGGSATSCDQVTVIAGVTMANRFFADGSFARFGAANASAGTAATLRVAAAAGAVPEPATWGLMLAGFGLIGAGLRSRGRRVSVTYA